MDDRLIRLAGSASILGGLLTLLVSVPPRWYGLGATDSYVFAPELFSPLWVDRTLVPALSGLAVIGLLAGLTALVRRDWAAYGRLRRWSSILALLGFSALSAAAIGGLVLAGNQSGTEVFTAIAVLLAGSFGILLFVPGSIGLGYGYVRAGKRAVGGGLVAVPVLVPVFAYTSLSPIPGLLTMLPVSITWVLVGRDLRSSAADQGSKR
jgi:hypothetical protein